MFGIEKEIGHSTLSLFYTNLLFLSRKKKSNRNSSEAEVSCQLFFSRNWTGMWSFLSFLPPFLHLFHLPCLLFILPSFPFSFLSSLPPFHHHLTFLSFHFSIFLPSISSSPCLPFLSLSHLPFLHFSIILPSHPSSSPLFFLPSIPSSSCLPLFPLSTFFPQTRMDGQSALPDFGAYTPSLQHYAQRESNHIQKLKGSVT